MERLRWFKGDAFPYYKVKVTMDGVPMSLSTSPAGNAWSTKKFRFHRQGAALSVEGDLTVTDAANGEGEYRWGASDLNTVGEYECQIILTDSASKILTLAAKSFEVVDKLPPTV